MIPSIPNGAGKLLIGTIGALGVFAGTGWAVNQATEQFTNDKGEARLTPMQQTVLVVVAAFILIGLLMAFVQMATSGRTKNALSLGMMAGWVAPVVTMGGYKAVTAMKGDDEKKPADPSKQLPDHATTDAVEEEQLGALTHLRRVANG